jgi:hypothetical protein
MRQEVTAAKERAHWALVPDGRVSIGEEIFYPGPAHCACCCGMWRLS